ncbi:multidrug resistance [Fusarium longipes]|uniref:Multidrug resistance n=1 Tax=Fusarium longipes TaxID=694270 RepID=A0A395SJV1_9HYPO|nr:multidrug resistance [Fusarium longipes]
MVESQTSNARSKYPSIVSPEAPMHEAIELVEYDFNHDFDVGSKYRGPPTPELEEAWDKLWRFDPVPFPESKLSHVNRTGGFRNGKEKLARLGDVKQNVTEDERGPIAANFEVFHQIHCLNYLRQYTWRDWYFNHPDKVIIPKDMLASDVGVRIHADHCIDYLRTTLMCHGDTTPFFTIIDASQPMGARGDFSAHHRCKDFGKLQDWNRKHGVSFGSFAEEHQ